MSVLQAESFQALGDVRVEVLNSVWHHRMLSTTQIWQLHWPTKSRKAANDGINELVKKGYLDYVKAPPPGREHFVFSTPLGKQTAIEAGMEPRTWLMKPKVARGGTRLHTWASNEVGIAFVKAARERGDECGPFSWRHEVAHLLPAGGVRGANRLLTADAVLSYTLGGEAVLQRFIEVDRGTKDATVVVTQLRSYATLLKSNSWQGAYLAFPRLLVVLAIPIERTARSRTNLLKRMLTTKEAGVVGSGLSVQFCWLKELQEHGPFAKIWEPLTGDQKVDLLGD